MLAFTVEIPAGNVSPITNLGVFVSRLAGTLLIIAAVIAFLFLVWGGVQMILAGGDKGKVEEARNRITGAIIGLAVTAAAWAIFLLIDTFLGLNIAGQTSSGPSAPGGSSGTTQYVRVDANTPCGSGNKKGFPYAYNCPVQCAGKTDVDCRGL
jgi:hypothetical protein